MLNLGETLRPNFESARQGTQKAVSAVTNFLTGKIAAVKDMVKPDPAQSINPSSYQASTNNIKTFTRSQNPVIAQQSSTEPTVAEAK